MDSKRKNNNDSNNRSENYPNNKDRETMNLSKKIIAH